MTTIDNTNYEQWLLLYAEGELTAEQSEAVEQWLASHPEAAEELALYNEAPRLEKDESVHYTAAPSQHTLPLWPAVLRWSAAAAVVAALMIPVTRMTTDDVQRHETPVVATLQENVIPDIDEDNDVTHPQTMPAKQHIPSARTMAEEPVLLADEMPVEQKDTVVVEHMIEDVAVPAVEYCDNLIVYETLPDTIYTDALVVYDNSRPSWTENVKDWAMDTRVAQWVRRRIKAREYELLAINIEY